MLQGSYCYKERICTYDSECGRLKRMAEERDRELRDWNCSFNSGAGGIRQKKGKEKSKNRSLSVIEVLKDRELENRFWYG